MTPGGCPSCGTPHGPRARYCLRCGALVGERSIDLDRAFAIAREREADAPPPAAPVPRASVWRRPGASALVTSALALGLLGGFLLGPEGGAAQRAPVVLGGAAAAAAPAAATSATPEATATPPEDGGDVDLAPAAAADDATATPSAGDDTTAATDDATTGDDTTSGEDTTSGDDTTAQDTTSDDGDGSSDLSGLVGSASALPPIEHVWVIAVTGPLTARDGSYLGEVLPALGTLLPAYAPGATDPLAGARALVGGGAPTLAGQLTAKGRTAKAYAAGAAACARNPFAAFAAAAGDAAACADVAQLPADLGAQGTTPSFSYILPDPALDAAGLDRFLEAVVAPIRRTEAYQSGGLIAIVPTAAADPAGATGALLLSPFAAASTSVDAAAGPGVLLRTVEDLFGLDPLGAAAADGVAALGSDVLAKG